ncbi:hypothetical protein HYH03_011260 [Edaphochlamys debaryana]|uniref:F-box/LRR-repeat protein 18 LRR domain-containing protein n=1 Tax=Edaphochlamys debaryana TaxID=47281 RepID=A0A835Y3C1_9CHLO|nr:hypothetical protein HYH03_011260 [Edaphochlamys debaryana]|eukprot:KAG2490309.1 hypothetical protein HYH03_011260 [Edaphochlamys debaryana]
MSDPHLLDLIAAHLKTPRERLRFACVNRACRQAVDQPRFWRDIKWQDVGGCEPGRAFSYPEAARMGNRLSALLRQVGRHVERLHLAGCPWLQATGLEDIARCQRLVHLDVSGCSLYSVDLLGPLARSCPSLRSLVARGCARIGEPAIIQGLWDAPEECGLQLEHLDLQGVLFPQDRVDTGGEDLGRAVARLAGPRLASLRLGWLGEASSPEPYQGDLGPVMELLGRSGEHLRLLDLAGCCSLPGCERALPSALARLSSLTALNLSNWVGGFALARGLRLCPATALTHLNLRGVDCVTDPDLAPLLSASPRLAAANLGCCRRLTDATLRALAAAAAGALTALDLCYASGMTSQGVLFASSAFPRLREFGFSGFAGLGDADVEAIATRLPGLRMIGIGGIPRLTDAALVCLATRLGPSLESIYASDLPNVGPAGLAALLGPSGPSPGPGGLAFRGCPRLRRLAVERCPRLGPQDLAAVRHLQWAFDGDMLDSEVVAAVNPYLAPPDVQG